jgi:CRISPR-associated endonuclease/helicase Cas3
LEEHLRSVARLAADFAGKWGASKIGHWMGLWHDLGKFNPDFQAYLEACETSPDYRRRGPDHASAGAVYAMDFWGLLAFPLTGHHGGLPNAVALKQRMHDKKDNVVIKEALRCAGGAIKKLVPDTPDNLLKELPERLQDPLRCEFFLRMLFSALVDADFLDTEAHFEPDKSSSRKRVFDFQGLWESFKAHQAKLSGHSNDPLNQARHEIYIACIQASEKPQGVFRLTVPTGGGKTLSGMAFALKHVLQHQLDRVIVAIPYTSIIEQTADIYRGIFGDEAVLEHHSALAAIETFEGPSNAEIWSHLAAENWDAPIIVTTTVQLFESLFANRPSRCRKLHNIARSVLILDEVQTLPVELLEPILDVLQDLVDYYGVTVILCTATQPALEESLHLKGLRNLHEIILEPSRYFAILKRVNYVISVHGEEWTWERVAAEMGTSPQCLTVVNTKKDARRLLQALDDPDALHLSTSLCGAHRRWVINEVHRRLRAGEPCRLVSTQVVEAGVDLDFPVVFRALGPLDRIVQVAGRCNREGRLTDEDGKRIPGRVVIFNPVDGGSPRGAYRSGMDEAESLLKEEDVNLDNPALYKRYFNRLYGDVKTDAKAIQELRRHLRFDEVNARFRMIPESTVSVVVRPPAELFEGPVIVDDLLAQICFRGGVSRELMRRLQPYLVGIYAKEVNRLRQAGLIFELCDGLYEWLGGYNRIYGLTEGARNPDDLIY